MCSRCNHSGEKQANHLSDLLRHLFLSGLLEQKQTRLMKELQAKLKLQKLPYQIECFDNSNIPSSFALFYGGSISDAIAAGLGAVLIWALQQYFRPVCMNEVTFQFAASFLTGCVICGLVLLCPFLHMDRIMIGDIMLLIPGLMSTNAIRDVLIGDTLSGIIRLIAALLLAAALALGFMGAILLFRRLGL